MAKDQPTESPRRRVSQILKTGLCGGPPTHSGSGSMGPGNLGHRRPLPQMSGLCGQGLCSPQGEGRERIHCFVCRARPLKAAQMSSRTWVSDGLRVSVELKEQRPP